MRSDERGCGGAAGSAGAAGVVLPRLRVAVLGSPRVGKSALIVRYLTRRFIGEYHSNTDLLYRQTVPVGGTPVELEVIDVSGVSAGHFPAEQVQWADACILVYSVTDRESFVHATGLLSALRKSSAHSTHSHQASHVGGMPAGTSAMPLALIGNKTDLDHLRQVRRTEGESASSAVGACFGEASVAEADSSAELYHCVDRLLAECRHRVSPPPSSAPARIRKFSVSKMLGGLIGNNPSTSSTARSGSVMICPRPPITAAAAP